MARDLADADVDVTVVDASAYTEYTPGILRAFVEGGRAHASLSADVARALPRNASFVHGVAEGVQLRPRGATVRVRAAGGARGAPPELVLHADALVIATGASYLLAKPAVHAAGEPAAPSAAARRAQLDGVAAAVAAAAHVLVVGGGPVGVEAAAEVAVAHARDLRAGRKRVTLLGGRGSELLGGGPLARAALAALRAAGVDVRLGASARGLDLAAEAAAAARGAPAARRAVELVDAAGAPAGRVEGVDVVLPAAGGAPNTAWAAGGLPRAALDGAARVAVNAAFEVAGAEGRAVFALGDAAAHPAREPALAHTAAKHGAAVAANVLRALRREPPLAYPASSLAGGAPGAAPVIFAVSLGPRAALLDFNGRLVLSSAGAVQWAVGWLKWTIEASQLSLMRGGWAGRAFWGVADPAAMLMGRVLPRNVQPQGESERR